MFRKLAVCLVMLTLLAIPVWGQDDGTVSLSLKRFLEISKTSQTDTGQAPLGAALGAGLYRVKADRDWAEVQATLKVQSFRAGWNEIDLLSGQVLVSEATIDGKPLPIYVKDGRYRFMIKGLGRHTLQMTYNLPVTDSGAASQLALETPPTSASKLTLELPYDKVQVTASPEIPLIEEAAKNKSQFRGVLNQEQTVTLRWTPLEVHPVTQGQTHKQEPKVYARVYSLATITEKAVRSKVQIDYSILRSSLDSVKVAIPTGSEVVDVACPNLSSWAIADSPEGRLLSVELSRPWTLNQSLELTLEKPIQEINSAWDLPLVEVLHAERVKGSLGIGASSGIEVQQANDSNLRPIDVSQLPPQVSQLSANPLLLAYEYHQEPFVVSLKTSKGKELPVLTATVDLAEATTLINKEGRKATAFVYHIRNNRKQSMTLTVPKDAVIQNAFVNGKAVKPILDSQETVRLPLVLSGSADASFTVEVTLTQKSDSLLPVVTSHLTAPIIDIPISEFLWQIYLPQDRDVWSDTGSMEPTNVGVSLSQAHLPVAFFVPRVGQRLAFRQLMVAEEGPSVSLTHSTELVRTSLWWFVLAGVLLLGARTARKREGWSRLFLSAGILVVVSMVLDFALLLPLLGAALLGLAILSGVWGLSHGRELFCKVRAGAAAKADKITPDETVVSPLEEDADSPTEVVEEEPDETTDTDSEEPPS